ncbi:MAG: CHRD domain-containing protein [Deinococcales bacterium]
MRRLFVGLAGMALLMGLMLPLAQSPPPGAVVYEAHLCCGDLVTGRETLKCVVGPCAASAAWVQAYVDGDELVVFGTYSGLSSPILEEVSTGVHLHRDPGVYHLDTIIRGLQHEGGVEGTIYGRVPLTPEYRTMLELQRMYVDIHTEAFPEGEIHGMLVPVRAGSGGAW